MDTTTTTAPKTGDTVVRKVGRDRNGTMAGAVVKVTKAQSPAHPDRVTVKWASGSTGIHDANHLTVID